MMAILKEYLPFIIPVVLIEFGLMAAALIHLLRRKRTRNLNVAAWVIIIILFEIIGPLFYFFIGREEE